MCNLYSLIKGQEAIRQLTKAMRDTTGNLQPSPDVFPDYSAPIVRTAEDGVRELTMARWGMPSPAFALEGKKVDKGVTNIRNAGSAHWRRWTTPKSRCVVPFTSFSENDKLPGGGFKPVWFALEESRPLAVFAGLWTSWTCTRVNRRRTGTPYRRPRGTPLSGSGTEMAGTVRAGCGVGRA